MRCYQPRTLSCTVVELSLGGLRGQGRARAMQQVKFIVLTSSRTGSTWLIDRWNKQSGVEAHGEVFLDRPCASPAIAGCANYRRIMEVHGSPHVTRILRVVSYLNELFRTPHTVGFKLMYAQIRKHSEMFACMAFRRLRKVHLTSGNQIDVIISEVLTRLTGTSPARVGEMAEPPMVYSDPFTSIDRIRQSSKRPGQVRRLIGLSNCPVIEVTYESCTTRRA